MTNVEEVSGIGCKCSGNHQHQQIEGQVKVGGKWVSRSRCVQIYSQGIVKALVDAIRKYRSKRVMEVFTSEGLKETSKNPQSNVMRAHVNLGHPSRERFIHMLRSAGASESATECAKQLSCSVCISNRLKEVPKVAKHKRAEGFNEQITMDTFDLPIYQQKVL